MMFGGCPSIEKLEALAGGAESSRLESHVAKCKACQGVVALLVGQTPDPVEQEACARAELLVAARQAGPLDRESEQELQDHAAACEACRELLDFSGE